VLGVLRWSVVIPCTGLVPAVPQADPLVVTTGPRPKPPSIPSSDTSWRLYLPLRRRLQGVRDRLALERGLVAIDAAQSQEPMSTLLVLASVCSVVLSALALSGKLVITGEVANAHG
jgi:hypothetical protein